jgi:hypothetical protein
VETYLFSLLRDPYTARRPRDAKFSARDYASSANPVKQSRIVRRDADISLWTERWSTIMARAMASSLLGTGELGGIAAAYNIVKTHRGLAARRPEADLRPQPLSWAVLL